MFLVVTALTGFEAVAPTVRWRTPIVICERGRFPRIVRIRQDKPPAEINPVEDVEAICVRQHGQSQC
jgi:hypothetical protein